VELGRVDRSLVLPDGLVKRGAGAAAGGGRVEVFSRDCGYLFGMAGAGVSSTADPRLIGCLAVCCVA
jgi:hypothetical protein